MADNPINQKIESALSSLDGLKHAEADDALFDGIWHRLNEKKNNLKAIVPMRTVWLAAASFALIIALNVSLLLKNEPNSHSTEGGHSPAARAIAQSYLNVN